MKLHVVEGRYAVARLSPHEAIPHWAHGELVAMTRTRDELSIVCDESAVPNDVRAERGWRCLAVAGPIPFETVGVAAAITNALAQASISLFFLSTFDTDYVLVKEESFARACEVLGLGAIA